MVGRTLSHYKVLEELSRGGMGIVYRALDVKLDREVALKVLPPELVADPERKRRFVQEAKAAAKLEHPHIGVVHEIDEAEGVTFIAMELIRGESLREIFRRERLPLQRTLELASEMSEALSVAHDKGIVHRDIKPENILVTEHGHAKIIDFGLAKLLEPFAGEGSEIETATRGVTRPGQLLGTVSYMSPEQARGQLVDHRSDIFSLGVVLYEMLTGESPFPAPSAPEVLNAIINAPAPPLDTSIAGDTTHELQRVVHKCLAKHPTERCQSMRELGMDLRATRQLVESGTAPSLVRAPSRTRSWLFSGIVAVAVLLFAAGIWLLVPNPASEVSPATSSRPSIAVLYFENSTGDPELEWLRTGLTDMLVTDLSQSPNLEVLSTERLVHILREKNLLDEGTTSLETMQEVAESAGTQTAILGSYMMAGDRLRINLRIQEASTAKILSTEKVEGIGDSAIFTMVDELTRRIKDKFEIPASESEELDQDLTNITTLSLEAYRHYAEGIRLHERYQEKEAIPHFKKAVELDPKFAMALAKLGVVSNNLGYQREADEYARRALEHIDRLTPRERYYVEGWYYSLKNETLPEAIEAYEKAVSLFPDHGSARHNLAGIYMNLERHEEARRHLEELRRRRMVFPETYGSLAVIYTRMGNESAAREVLHEYLERNPASWPTHLSLAETDAFFGRLDDALESIEKAKQLGAPEFRVQSVQLLVRFSQEKWDEAEALALALFESPNPMLKVQGRQVLSLIQLYKGHSRQALDDIAEGIPAVENVPYFADIYNFLSYVHLQRREPQLALEMAEKACREDNEPSVRREGLARAALATMGLGGLDEAEKWVEEYRAQVVNEPSEIGMRRYYHLTGALARARGNPSEAVEVLNKAASMLLPRSWSDEHAEIWFALAMAHHEADDEAQSEEWFIRLTDSRTERFSAPIPYVRSFYFLGKIHENRGEMEKAHEYYRRFYKYWKDGDMDRERVEEAKSKLGTT